MKRACPIVLVGLLHAGAAFAADPKNGNGDPSAAQSLFYEARALMAQGRYAEACPKLEESNRLDRGIGTQFNLADCNEHIGKIATAWAGFVDVAAQSKAANQLEREKVARKRAQTIEARVPKLVVEVPAAPPGLEVKRDGVVVGQAQWGTPIPVDPGAHKIVATAPGRQPWETTVTATEGRAAKVVLPRELPAAVVAVAPAPPPRPPEPSSTTTTTSDVQSVQTYDFPEPVDESSGSAQRTVGWVVTALGVGGLAVAGGFGIDSINKRNDSRDHCNGDACDATGVSLRDDAIRSGNVATVTAIAGGAAVAGGLVLVLTSPRGDRRHGRIRAVPSVAANGGGVLFEGRWP
jgi:hypothetical protein